MRERLRARLARLEAAADVRDAPPLLVIPGHVHTWPADAATVARWGERARVQQEQLAESLR